jgi:hypothetical protein
MEIVTGGLVSDASGEPSAFLWGLLRQQAIALPRRIIVRLLSVGRAL